MEVTALTPRGYCHGVVGAVNTLKRIARDKTVKQPIHVLGMIVHNQKIVDDLDRLGVITLHEKGVSRLELLDRIDSGTVVFTAHGVSDAVKKKAESKNLDIIDTTCRDVLRSQRTVESYINEGYDVIFIGKEDHPESETIRSFGPRAHVVSNENDVKQLTIDNPKIALTNQTTMSLFDVYGLSETIKKRYPAVEVIEEICDATKTRQLAVQNQPDDIDHCFVVGDPHSNNSKKLVEVSKRSGVPASLIESVEDIDIDALKPLHKVSVTSGASTPTKLTNEVLRFLRAFDKDDPKTHDTTSKVKHANLFKT
ncbi:MAG: 4-hydroxy-3-methylbut-2-enyl diphosphate reductase [Bacillota bacterium]